MKDKDDNKSCNIIICTKDCSCHQGARYDQIECRCEWFCGEPYTVELVNELMNDKSGNKYCKCSNEDNWTTRKDALGLWYTPWCKKCECYA